MTTISLSESIRRSGLVFQPEPPIVPSEPNRADVALFVGFVARRATHVPAALCRWLRAQGWTQPDHGRTPIATLLDVPVPIDTWPVFDRLFAWDTRPVKEDLSIGRGTPASLPVVVPTYLGAAVRSFFAQGGRKCYVVRAGDPWPAGAFLADSQRAKYLELLLPGYPASFGISPMEPRAWRGIGHLAGLPDVSFLCLPDLAEMVAVAPHELPDLPAPDIPPQQFVECSQGEEQIPSGGSLSLPLRAPHADEAGYGLWADVVSRVAGVLFDHAREVQLVVAAPLPDPQSAPDAERDLLGFLTDRGRGPLSRGIANQQHGIASAFVQLAYPWLRTPASARLPEKLESPDGVLAGVLARNALARGAFRSAAGQSPAEVYDVYPALSNAQVHMAQADGRSLLERVSLFGMTPQGLALLSDVTASVNESYRPACVNRLVTAIVRAARRLGEGLVFEPSGERLWALLRQDLEDLLLGLLHAGALRGRTPAEAFQVRCGRSTMTQNDIDAGRVIAEVEFDATAPIDRITVVLALNEGGQVSLVSGGEDAAATDPVSDSESEGACSDAR